MASFNFTNLARALVKGEIDFDTATFKVLLVSSVPTTTDTTGDKHTWIDRADITNEITGTGYTAGGISQAFTLNAATLVGGAQSVSWTDITNGWTSSTLSAVGAIIYLDTGVAANDLLLHFVDFGGTVTCTAGNFSIDYTSNFIVTA